jgi:hypothetical protein
MAVHILDDRGTRPLKGVEGDWQLFAVHRPGNPFQPLNASVDSSPSR